MPRRIRIVGAILLAGLLASAALAVEGDVVLSRKGGTGGVPLAVFPHWFHRIRYKCYACHDAIFKMKQGADDVTMDAITAGKFCGACHDGKTAWGVTFETCNRCHIER